MCLALLEICSYREVGLVARGVTGHLFFGVRGLFDIWLDGSRCFDILMA